MENSAFFEKEMMVSDGTPVRLVYDREADILEVFFGKNEPATGVELTDHILLRLNLETRRPISLSLLHFSILTEQTEFGPRSYALDKIAEAPEDLRDLTLQLLTTEPLRQFLTVTHFQASPTKQIPITFVASQPSLTAA